VDDEGMAEVAGARIVAVVGHPRGSARSPTRARIANHARQEMFRFRPAPFDHGRQQHVHASLISLVAHVCPVCQRGFAELHDLNLHLDCGCANKSCVLRSMALEDEARRSALFRGCRLLLLLALQVGWVLVAALLVPLTGAADRPRIFAVGHVPQFLVYMFTMFFAVATLAFVYNFRRHGNAWFHEDGTASNFFVSTSFAHLLFIYSMCFVHGALNGLLFCFVVIPVGICLLSLSFAWREFLPSRDPYAVPESAKTEGCVCKALARCCCFNYFGFINCVVFHVLWYPCVIGIVMLYTSHLWPCLDEGEVMSDEWSTCGRLLCAPPTDHPRPVRTPHRAECRSAAKLPACAKR